jgi:hypothetical protein
MEVMCMVVREDESTDILDVLSLSMRGAQREITGYLISHGYKRQVRLRRCGRLTGGIEQRRGKPCLDGHHR